MCDLSTKPNEINVMSNTLSPAIFLKLWNQWKSVIFIAFTNNNYAAYSAYSSRGQHVEIPAGKEKVNAPIEEEEKENQT